MPDRLIRDELLDSDRWLGLPADTDRLAFIALLFRCDDFGNLEGGPRRLFRFLQTITQVKTEEAAATVLLHLADADLIRRYEVDGRELFHIPRFRQQRWYVARKYPPSPWDDPEKQLGKNTRKIYNQGLAKNLTATLLQQSSSIAEGVGDGVGDGVNKPLTFVLDAGASEDRNNGLPNCPHEKIVALYHETLPTAVRVKIWDGADKTHLQSRWRETCKRLELKTEGEGLEWFGTLFEYVAGTKFLTGKVPPSNGHAQFKLRLSWMVVPANFKKLIEQVYE